MFPHSPCPGSCPDTPAQAVTQLSFPEGSLCTLISDCVLCGLLPAQLLPDGADGSVPCLCHDALAAQVRSE